ncbi:MAG: hypothetical protein K1X29_11615 [Bdellovibrionales bacterium]|nr:hypothetical protein [Bdellovibrionales bacterium]
MKKISGLNFCLTTLLLFLNLFLSACASYQTELQTSLSLLRQNEAPKAAEQLKVKAEKESDDQVVYLFEYGTALELAKDYKLSNQVFLKAEELTDIKDYHSLSRIGGSLLLNEGMVQYKGEDYEKVFLNALLAINYLMLNNLEDAQVETRKLNDKLYKYRFEAKRDYQQNPFAFYLSAMIWESSGKWDDAYIDYKKAYELNPNVSFLKSDLIRSSRLAHRPEEWEKWKKTFANSNLPPKPDPKNQGELILIYQQGWAPRKYPHPSWPRIPKLYHTPSQTQFSRLIINNKPSVSSEVVSSLEEVAIKTLDDAYAGLIAKRAAGIAAKAVVSEQIRNKNKLLGDLAWIGMNLADRADLRQWVTLPQTFQLAKVWLPPGEYNVYAEGLNSSSLPTGERSEVFKIHIKSGKKEFIHWRSLQ